MAELPNETLQLRFHGRILDSLGIQMYQSPVAAIAELIANAWDADAEVVKVQIPTESIKHSSTITISDNGHGMTFQQCQERYLNIGRNRREELNSDKTSNGRPALGRKGIGKFAGFGIANILEVDTTSSETGERTHFLLDLDELRGDSYISERPQEIRILHRTQADPDNKVNAGTTILLKKLKMSRRPSPEGFLKSMARRFLINQSSDNFTITVNDDPLPEDNALSKVEFDFPNSYRDGKKPDNVEIENDWAVETLPGSDHEIKWRIKFTEKPITTDEFRGVSIYCGIKVAQTPFFFNLSGGLSGQHGQQYMSGEVKADFIDQLDTDIITTERQRINWEDRNSDILLVWGQAKIRELLSLWKALRAAGRIKILEERTEIFSSRLGRLEKSERKTVSNALHKLASIDSLDNEKFIDVSNAMLTAWEGGRLRGLISEIDRVEDMDAGVLLTLLAEESVLSALHMSEIIQTKMKVLSGLRQRIADKELENAVRDYIADNPWLLSPDWETYKVEKSLKTIVDEAAKEAGLNDEDTQIEEEGQKNKRVDLILASGTQLLIVEFMRPGLTIDRDHLNRYEGYMQTIEAKLKANTGYKYNTITGLLVADKLEKNPAIQLKIKALADNGMLAIEWNGLLAKAERQWKEFGVAILDRAPDDERLLEFGKTI